MKQLTKQPLHLIIAIITFIYMLTAFTVATAQTRVGRYNEVTTDHFKASEYPHVSSTTTVYKNGLLSVTASNIGIDTAVYKIVETGKFEDEDEGMRSRTMTIIYTTPKTKKLMDVVVIYNPNKSPMAVILKRSKATKTTYMFKD